MEASFSDRIAAEIRRGQISLADEEELTLVERGLVEKVPSPGVPTPRFTQR